ncbi:hypothetical protein U9M48_013435 [Paspalum notatum var. saurae]|uniref:Uncharacterized protein n=1 Tax=Paspalum notatum var. saurae TaxID=547442 RepID=A0AAQ3WJE9_PASNO
MNRTTGASKTQIPVYPQRAIITRRSSPRQPMLATPSASGSALPSSLSFPVLHRPNHRWKKNPIPPPCSQMAHSNSGAATSASADGKALRPLLQPHVETEGVSAPAHPPLRA